MSRHLATVDRRLAVIASRARRAVESLGGRYSTEAGIDVDAGGAHVERWFLASTLFGARISAAIAQRTFRVFEASGFERIAQARDIRWEDLVAMLDAGGYARYDFQTATRLQTLSDAVRERYGGQVAAIGRRFHAYGELRDALADLPGWGPVTVEVFLRELRGTWPGAEPPLDDRAAGAARHLGLIDPLSHTDPLGAVARIADVAGLDLRDLESGLVRLALVHRRDLVACPGGGACIGLRPAERSRRTA